MMQGKNLIKMVLWTGLLSRVLLLITREATSERTLWLSSSLCMSLVRNHLCVGCAPGNSSYGHVKTHHNTGTL